MVSGYSCKWTEDWDLGFGFGIGSIPLYFTKISYGLLCLYLDCIFTRNLFCGFNVITMTLTPPPLEYLSMNVSHPP